MNATNDGPKDWRSWKALFNETYCLPSILLQQKFPSTMCAQTSTPETCPVTMLHGISMYLVPVGVVHGKHEKADQSSFLTKSERAVACAFRV